MESIHLCTQLLQTKIIGFVDSSLHIGKLPPILARYFFISIKNKFWRHIKQKAWGSAIGQRARGARVERRAKKKSRLWTYFIVVFDAKKGIILRFNFIFTSCMPAFNFYCNIPICHHCIEQCRNYFICIMFIHQKNSGSYPSHCIYF